MSDDTGRLDTLAAQPSEVPPNCDVPMLIEAVEDGYRHVWGGYLALARHFEKHGPPEEATGEPGTRISADASQHAPATGNVMVKNYGENVGWAEAPARSGAFTPQKEVLGGTPVEMKVVDASLKAQLGLREQDRGVARSQPTRQPARDHGL